MATLTGNSVASTYKQLLKVTSEGIGADASAKYIEDGLGTDSALSISTTRVGIGTTSPSALLSLEATQESDAGIQITLNADLDSQAPQLTFLRAAADGSTVDDGDVLGQIKFGGYDSNSFEVNAKIDAVVNGTPSNNVMPIDMNFYTSSAGTSVLAMTIDKSQNVGIGTASPANPLAVNRSGDGVIVDFESADAVEGTVSISGTTTSYNAFVGSHYTQLKDGQNDLPVGAVVSSTGEIITCNFVTEAIDAVEAVEAVEAKDAVLDDDGNITEEAVEAVAAVEAVEAIEATTTNVPNKEYFTYINTTTTQSDPAVYGTWMGKMSDDAKGHSFGDDEKPIYLVAQVGLFKIRVTDTNGNIANGDYLESSTRAMEGQKQTSNAKVNSTICKAMIDVDWSSIDADSELGYKWKLIPCTF